MIRSLNASWDAVELVLCLVACTGGHDIRVSRAARASGMLRPCFPAKRSMNPREGSKVACLRTRRGEEACRDVPGEGAERPPDLWRTGFVSWSVILVQTFGNSARPHRVG